MTNHQKIFKDAEFHKGQQNSFKLVRAEEESGRATINSPAIPQESNPMANIPYFRFIQQQSKLCLLRG